MRIGIGTAQFGLDYGVTNTTGRPEESSIFQILRRAHSAGITLLDTAQKYGNSEEIIGRMKPNGTHFDVVSKLSPTIAKDEKWTKSTAKLIYRSIIQSLERLGTDQLYGVLLHNTNALSYPNSQYLLEGLAKAKQDQLVGRIGFSAYNAAEIDHSLEVLTPDLIQVPVSIFDQRLLHSGHLIRLKQLGTEVHLRSLFLQGLILMNQNRLPNWAAPLTPAFKALDKFCLEQGHGISRKQACVAFGLNLKTADKCIVGINSVAELVELLGCVELSNKLDLDFSDLAWPSDELLDPSKWPN